MNSKKLLISVIILLFLVALLVSSRVASRVALSLSSLPQSGLSEQMLMYAANPSFVSGDFLKQLTGTEARLERLNLDEEIAYFSTPKSAWKATVDALTLNTNRVEFGEWSDERQGTVLGNYVLYRPEVHFFRIPMQNFKVNRAIIIVKRFRRADYRVNVQELSDFIANKSVFGGYLTVKLGENGLENVVMANHCPLVARKGESSLSRFVSSLLGTNRVERHVAAQKLRDFVGTEVEYSGEEAAASVETLKRPSEVLLSGTSDCSGKAILLASLYEQAGVEYLLCYMRDPLTRQRHITVAVCGNFSTSNGHYFTYEEKKYFIAEPTARWFVIGKTPIRLDITDIEFVQKPGSGTPLINVKTGLPAPFL